MSSGGTYRTSGSLAAVLGDGPQVLCGSARRGTTSALPLALLAQAPAFSSIVGKAGGLDSPAIFCANHASVSACAFWSSARKSGEPVHLSGAVGTTSGTACDRFSGS